MKEDLSIKTYLITERFVNHIENLGLKRGSSAIDQLLDLVAQCKMYLQKNPIQG
jgi:hypothetical protein